VTAAAAAAKQTKATRQFLFGFLSRKNKNNYFVSIQII
jgi:hypothetical protein